MPGFNDPLIPQRYLERAQSALDSPALGRSPWEARLRGFGAGALEGLYNQITPMNLGMAAIPALGAMGRTAGAARSGLQAAAPIMDEAGRSLGALAKAGPVAKGLTRNVPQGAEQAYIDYIRQHIR
jgi:hypothetical protein